MVREEAGGAPSEVGSNLAFSPPKKFGLDGVGEMPKAQGPKKSQAPNPNQTGFLVFLAVFGRFLRFFWLFHFLADLAKLAKWRRNASPFSATTGAC